MDEDWEKVKRNINYVSLNEDLLPLGVYFNGIVFINVSTGKKVASLQLTDYGWVIVHDEGSSNYSFDKVFISHLSASINKTFKNGYKDKPELKNDTKSTKVKKSTKSNSKNKSKKKVTYHSTTIKQSILEKQGHVSSTVMKALKVLEILPSDNWDDYSQIASILETTSNTVYNWYRKGVSPSESIAKHIINKFDSSKKYKETVK